MNEPRLRRIAGVETRLLDGAAVLVIPHQHLYFAINRVGARIWELLAEPQSLETLAAILATEFDIDEPQCRQEADAFLQQLVAQNLIQRVL